MLLRPLKILIDWFWIYNKYLSFKGWVQGELSGAADTFADRHASFRGFLGVRKHSVILVCHQYFTAIGLYFSKENADF